MRMPLDDLFEARQYLWRSKLRVLGLIGFVFFLITLASTLISTGEFVWNGYNWIKDYLEPHKLLLTFSLIFFMYAIVEYDCKAQIKRDRDHILEIINKKAASYLDGASAERTKIHEFMHDISLMLAAQSDLTRLQSSTQEIRKRDDQFERRLTNWGSFKSWGDDPPTLELYEFQNIDVASLVDLFKQIRDTYNLRDLSPVSDIDEAIAGERSNKFDDKFDESGRIAYRRYKARVDRFTGELFKEYQRSLEGIVNSARNRIAGRVSVPE